MQIYPDKHPLIYNDIVVLVKKFLRSKGLSSPQPREDFTVSCTRDEENSECRIYYIVNRDYPNPTIEELEALASDIDCCNREAEADKVRSGIMANKLPLVSNRTLPEASEDLEGALVYNTDTRRLMYSNGSEWTSI